MSRLEKWSVDELLMEALKKPEQDRSAYLDLMCRDDQDSWVAVEVKRVATTDAVDQLSRYLERIRVDPELADCRGILAAEVVKPQARTLAESRELGCVEIDLAVLRGEKEPELKLF